MPHFIDQHAQGDEPGGPEWEILLWADEVHEQNESCVLSFWRLSFAPDYDRQAIFDKLDRFYADMDITAHIAYETLGEFDILLRLWIPRRYIPDEIENQLRTRLAEHSLWDVNYMAGRTHTHWADIAGERRPLEAPVAVADSLITSINEFNDSQARGTAVTRPEGCEPLIARGVLTPIPLRWRGVRVYITFDRPRRALTPNARADVLAQIKEKCSQVRREWIAQHPVNASDDPDKTDPQISIYSGVGTMTDFFVMARAPHGDFHQFIRSLVLGLRTTNLGRVYQMRPYTYVIADRMFSEFSEHRLTVGSAGFTDEMVDANETESLEFKSSFAVNLRRYRSEGVVAADPATMDQAVKAVCGLLNSRDGGTLVIGVLETQREYEKAGRHAKDLLEWLRTTFAYDPNPDGAGESRHPLPNAVLGVGFEFGDDGVYQDFDKYQAAIQDTLESHIEPNPWPWLRMAAREARGHEVMVISVRPADTWCYARLSKSRDLQFFVREAASTRAYSGHEADLYRSANPRAPMRTTV